MEFLYNDGGRADAGYKGTARDCVCRAIAIATGKSYAEIYEYLAVQNKKQKGIKSARNGIFTKGKWFKDYMKSLGFEWVSCMGIGTGCKVHLKKSELPSGTIICSVSRHFVAVIDGVINDTYNCSRNETRCVYGYWKLNNRLETL